MKIDHNRIGQMKPWQKKLHHVIFGTGTYAGRIFDLLLLSAIILSIIAVMLESVEEIRREYHSWLYATEWIFTILFTIEYIARILVSINRFRYIFSFYGIIDFVAVVPTYLTLIFTETQYLVVIRALRLLRVFRIFKLGRFIGEGEIIAQALVTSRHKIVVFLGAVLTVVTIMGTFMYLVESAEAGFTSIPRSVYWAIVTLTTVGYGDIAPETFIGQAVASVIMITGYSIIAVPTGIVTSEIVKHSTQKKVTTKHCTVCLKEDHEVDAKFCKHCGGKLID